MITYEKVKYLKDEILGEELLKNGRKSEKFFTRNRKIGFSDIIFLTLNKRGLSLKMEMSNFGDISGRIGNASSASVSDYIRGNLNGVGVFSVSFDI